MIYNRWALKLPVMLLLMLVAPADAKNNGVGDGDYSLNETGMNAPYCGTKSCHIGPYPGSGISISASPAGPYTTTHKINITINVTTFNISDPNDIQGIMLLNNTPPYNGNIKNDGWSITKDEIHSTTPVNYNEKTNLSTLNQTYFWNVTVPSIPGTYHIKARAHYGAEPKGDRGYNVTTDALSMVVLSGDEDIALSNATEKGSPASPGRCGTGCHATSSGGAAISITASPAGPYNTSQQDIVVTVSTSNINVADDIISIVLLNNTLPLNGNIKNDGWQIASDANNNPAPYNQNERAVMTLDQTFSWNITAPPTPGTYYIMAQARYGGGTGYIISSTPLTMTVVLPVPEFPAGAALPLIASVIAFLILRKKMC